jgi:hypothetical protein
MGIRKIVRETLFNLARQDLATFLQDHEEDLLRVFHEEIRQLDEKIPEENLFIDIKMVPLSEVIMRAVLRAMRRFLTNDFPEELPETSVPAPENDRET